MGCPHEDVNISHACDPRLLLQHRLSQSASQQPDAQTLREKPGNPSPARVASSVGSQQHVRMAARTSRVSVSSSHRSPVCHYIEPQEEHNRHLDFREELLDFLKRSGIEYDERWVGD